jgi:hypothetical protein
MTEPSPVSPASEETKWFEQLDKGAIQYKVPATMYWKDSSTVTVVIQGPRAGASSELAGATGSGTTKVSDRMKVAISCPDNPDEFTISPEPGTTEIQYVPADGSATWNWSVTPAYTGKSQTMVITAWVLYPGYDDKYLRQLPVYTAKIDVHVPGLGECLKKLIEGDSDYWVHYGLPGGGGFVFVSGIVLGLLKRARGKKQRTRRQASNRKT